MAPPPTHQPMIDAPDPKKIRNFGWMYKFLHDMWMRTGGQKSAVYNLSGLEASVKELNTLVGVSTAETVQQQIDKKEDKDKLGTMAYQNATNVTIEGGTITGASISRSSITIQAGGCIDCQIKLNGTLHTDMQEVGNIGSGEDKLISYSMPASVLADNRQFIEINAFGVVAANANNKRIKLKFGSTTLIDTGSVAANDGSWEITAVISRVESSAEKCSVKIISDNTLIINKAVYTKALEDTTATIDIYCTGEGVSDDDIIQEGLIIKWFSN